ncbi:MAG: general secretion pathway protein GspK [Rhodobacteraceae bacterium]|nr:general secretion pathway protein GspK [Paracoccaceae bacterium]
MTWAGRETASRSRRGFILVAVLWVALFLAVAVGSVATLSQTARFRIEAMARRAQAEAVLHAAVRLIALRLATGDVEAVAAIGADAPLRLKVAGGRAEAVIVAQSAKIDVNRADLPLLTELFIEAGAEPSAAEAAASSVVDFRDPDDLRQLNGAEAAEYEGAGRRFGPRNGPFLREDELGLVLNVSPELARRAAALATVYGGRGGGGPRGLEHLRVQGPIPGVNPVSPSSILSGGIAAPATTGPRGGSGGRNLRDVYRLGVSAASAEGAIAKAVAYIKADPGAIPPFTVIELRPE